MSKKRIVSTGYAEQDYIFNSDTSSKPRLFFTFAVFTKKKKYSEFIWILPVGLNILEARFNYFP